MNFTAKANVYATPDGMVTHDAGHGKNTLLLETGAVVSEAEASSLGLRKLGKELDKQAVEAAEAVGSPLGALQAIREAADATPEEAAQGFAGEPANEVAPPATFAPADPPRGRKVAPAGVPALSTSTAPQATAPQAPTSEV